ncbi:hypothetical protein ETB97_012141 [Aspergillus alliaceus]|uniref:Uncharacterized protein n=1 Tax=Petromyces alliaceus TaxID=209559 RepID=A0A8H6A597_PETAA|nr:hypothetical protein ETB97_012141 [Aspergillus burnettii]
MGSEDFCNIPSLVDAMNKVTAAYKSSLLPDPAASLSPILSETEVERQHLASAARGLLAVVQEPRQAVLQLGLQGPLLACIRTAITLNIFGLIPHNSEGITATELQVKTGADKALIIRIMRAMTSSKLVLELGEERYAHTPTSLAFLSPVCGIFTHLFDEGLPTAWKIPEYLATMGYKDPNENGMTAFQYAFQTHLPFFEWLGVHPKQRESYITGMSSSYRGGKSVGLAYPFDIELAGCTENEVVMVDIGGNAGQLLVQIKERFPQLSGRMIVQDRAETLKAAQQKQGIEYMPHDFFTPQPVIGAKAYYFRSIFHDWSDAFCRKILQNLVPSMTPGYSKLLISDAVLPSVDAPLYWALMDIQMMGISGLERTERQWRDLLESEGLQIVKIWASKAKDEFVIEAALPC